MANSADPDKPKAQESCCDHLVIRPSIHPSVAVHTFERFSTGTSRPIFFIFFLEPSVNGGLKIVQMVSFC